MTDKAIRSVGLAYYYGKWLRALSTEPSYSLDLEWLRIYTDNFIAMEEPDDLVEKVRSLLDQDNPLDYSIDIEGPKINRYKAYASIELDLKIVKRYLKALQAISESVKTGAMERDELTQTFERSLYTSSIISYARCFTETKGRGVQLNTNDCFKVRSTW